MTRHFDMPNRGQPPKAAELQRLADAVYRQQKVLPSLSSASVLGGNIEVGQNADGMTIVGTNYQPFWAKITSNSGTPKAYAWTEQQQNSAGTFVDHDQARTGSTSEWPAYEVNGADVPSGTFAQLWLGHTGDYYLFAHSAGGGADHVCRLDGITSGSLSSFGTLTLSWSTENKDTDAFHDAGTNPTRVTIPTGLDGDYLIAFACLLSIGGTPTVGEGIKAEIKKNGSSVLTTIGAVWTRGGTAANACMNGCVEVTLAATDYLEVALDSREASAANVFSPWLSVRKIDKAG